MSNTSAFSLLVIDDEPDLRTLYELTLLREGYELDTAGTVEEALAHLNRRHYSAVITDMRLPDGSGLDVLSWLDQQARSEKALVITAHGSAENAVEALKAGAYDYLTKPVDLRQFRSVVASALGRLPAAPPQANSSASPKPAAPAPAAAAGARAEASAPSTGAPAPPAAAARSAPAQRSRPTAGRPESTLQRLAGDSAAMQQVRSLIAKVARSMAPVLLQGESGTGKELVARSIHEVSERGAQAFIAVNCGAIPEQLLEAEFFGYRKGAFTGANEDREGFFQAADGGTLFLDEIGDLPLAMQSKLLRAIQERSVRPVGAVAEASVNVRILSATHKDLGAEVTAGKFRQDLYYRLNVIQIRVPPLRERLEDLRAIAERVLERIALDAGVSPPPRLTAAALSQLARYAFPGNVRELENLLHRALALAGGELIDAEDLGLPEAVLDDSQFGALDALNTATETAARAERPRSGADLEPLPRDLAQYLDEVERAILLRALELHGFNRTAAGAGLGLSLRQIRYRMARLSITADDASPEGDAGVSS